MPAGGSGITPMLQIIDAIVKDESDSTEVRSALVCLFSLRTIMILIVLSGVPHRRVYWVSKVKVIVLATTRSRFENESPSLINDRANHKENLPSNS